MSYKLLFLLLLLFLSSVFGQNVNVWFSSELKPESPEWFTDPPYPSEIKYKISPQSPLQWDSVSTENITEIRINPVEQKQKILGILFEKVKSGNFK